MIGGGVEILRRAPVALHFAQRRVTGVHRRATELQQGFQQPLQGRLVRRLHLQPEIGWLAIGAADAELVHFEAAVEFHDLIEDVLHHVRIDQVPFGLDYFLQWHGEYQFSVTAVAAPRSNRRRIGDAGDFSMIIAEVLELPEAGIAEICRRYQVKALSLFGSAARGEMRPDSDIDLLVEFLPEAEIGLLQHFAAERELSALLRRKVDLVSKRAIRKTLMEEIFSQARLIYAA